LLALDHLKFADDTYLVVSAANTKTCADELRTRWMQDGLFHSHWASSSITSGQQPIISYVLTACPGLLYALRMLMLRSHGLPEL